MDVKRIIKKQGDVSKTDFHKVRKTCELPIQRIKKHSAPKKKHLESLLNAHFKFQLSSSIWAIRKLDQKKVGSQNWKPSKSTFKTSAKKIKDIFHEKKNVEK